jgi:iron complex transport system permease protein
MNESNTIGKLLRVSILSAGVLAVAGFLGLAIGSSGSEAAALLRSLMGQPLENQMLTTIIWKIRLPRVILAALVGGTLSLGGLVFQALLRNPLAEPYILGISGGSAVGAIIGILLGFSRIPGVSLTAFAGSLATLGLLVLMGSGRNLLHNDALLLSGVMVNAFCSAIIMFLVSMTQDARLHNIIFWLMGDLSAVNTSQALSLFGLLLPCFLIVFWLSHNMNLLQMGNDMAAGMGVRVAANRIGLLVLTSLMVSVTVSFCGLIGFVGLVIPHVFRLALGPDHRILVPACVLGGGAYMVLCDLLARTLPQQGEMPAGVVTALIGAPLFIYLLKRTQR